MGQGMESRNRVLLGAERSATAQVGPPAPRPGAQTRVPLHLFVPPAHASLSGSGSARVSVLVVSSRFPSCSVLVLDAPLCLRLPLPVLPLPLSFLHPKFAPNLR